MGISFHKQSDPVPSLVFDKTVAPKQPTKTTTTQFTMAAKDRNLLTTLMLLGARLAPELEAVRDEMVLDTNPKQRIVSLLASAILEDSRVFGSARGAALFSGVAEHRWINVRLSTFNDKARMVQILEAVDPRGLFWPELCHCSSLSAWTKTGNCQELVQTLLAECNIEYSLYEHFIQINPDKLFNSLACAMLAAPDAKIDTLYAVLFSPETLRAVADNMQTVVLQVSQGDVPHDQDLTTCLKLMVGFVSVFLGAGLVLGHTMAPA